MKNVVTIFRSQYPEPYAQAVTLLRSANIPFQAFDRREGGSKTPRTVHMIAVQPEQETHARNTISSIPSEIILAALQSTPTRGDRIIAWIQVSIILIIIVVSVIRTLLD